MRRGRSRPPHRRKAFTPKPFGGDKAGSSLVQVPVLPGKRVPLRYVVLGVTLYCTVAWALVIVGVQAGMRAYNSGPSFFASSGPSAKAGD